MEKSGNSEPIKTIDEYLGCLTEREIIALETLRRQIKEAAPLAEECISWGMPMLKWNGQLVGFAAFKNHLSFFPGSPPMMEAIKDDLVGWKTAKATIQFTPEKPLPAELVQKIVRIRMAENEARKQAKIRSK